MNPIEVINAIKLKNRRGAAIMGSALLAVVLVATAYAAPAAASDRTKTKKEKKASGAEVSRADKPYLGVTMQELDEEVLRGLDAETVKGVLISQVLEGSPAEEAGIQDGDIVVEFDGKGVEAPDQLKDLVAKFRVGEAVKVKLLREGEARTVDVTVGQWPEDAEWEAGEPEEFHWYGDPAQFHAMFLGRGRLGVRVTEINEGLSPYFGVKEGEGVLVLDVNDETTAAEMGIRAGDVIVRVKDEEVGSVEDLHEAVGELGSGESFDVTVVRAKKEVKLEGKAGDRPEDGLRKLVRLKPDAPMRQFKFHGIPDDEMEKMKQEMKELRKELEKMKDELKKLGESN
jgi:S1-C subfamily serine protease